MSAVAVEGCPRGRARLPVLGLAVTFVMVLAAPARGAADPVGDLVPCPRVLHGDTGDPPDLIAATGEVVELGTSVRFTLRFAEPLAVPDRSGRPFRVEVVLHDPEVPGVDAGLYRGVNRILRYDAVPDAVTTTLLLPEAGQSRFIAPTIDGDALVFQVPGRTLVADEDETGTSPGVSQLTWGVIARDEGTCDLLGDGRATGRLVVVEEASTATATSSVAASTGDRGGVPGWALAAAVAIVVVTAVGLVRRFVPRRG